MGKDSAQGKVAAFFKKDEQGSVTGDDFATVEKEIPLAIAESVGDKIKISATEQPEVGCYVQPQRGIDWNQSEIWKPSVNGSMLTSGLGCPWSIHRYDIQCRIPALADYIAGLKKSIAKLNDKRNHNLDAQINSTAMWNALAAQIGAQITRREAEGACPDACPDFIYADYSLHLVAGFLRHFRKQIERGLLRGMIQIRYFCVSSTPPTDVPPEPGDSWIPEQKVAPALRGAEAAKVKDWAGRIGTWVSTLKPKCESKGDVEICQFHISKKVVRRDRDDDTVFFLNHTVKSWNEEQFFCPEPCTTSIFPKDKKKKAVCTEGKGNDNTKSVVTRCCRVYSYRCEEPADGCFGAPDGWLEQGGPSAPFLSSCGGGSRRPPVVDAARLVAQKAGVEFDSAHRGWLAGQVSLSQSEHERLLSPPQGRAYVVPSDS